MHVPDATTFLDRKSSLGPAVATVAFHRADAAALDKLPRAVGLLDQAIVRLLPAVPRPVVQRLSDRYLAGPDLADACRVIRSENAAGKLATVDVLGEAVDTEEEAREFVDDYLQALEAIEAHGLDANVSVKPTAFGLSIDYDLCRANVDELLQAAARRENFVRVEMEDSSTTEATIGLYRDLRADGHENTGLVLQAYLHRTQDDIERLLDLRPNVRLVKGIYVERPSIAYLGHQEIRDSFVRCLDLLLAAGCYVGIATHDEWLIDEALRLVSGLRLDREDYEFQMLLGVTVRRGEELVAEGHRVRTYVPYGKRWYEYSLRRLQENPKLAGYIAGDTVQRLLHFGRSNGR
jgi:proline dehydrogenase